MFCRDRSHSVVLAVLQLLYRTGWLQTLNDPFVSAFRVLSLKACTTTPDLIGIFVGIREEGCLSKLVTELHHSRELCLLSGLRGNGRRQSRAGFLSTPHPSFPSCNLGTSFRINDLCGLKSSHICHCCLDSRQMLVGEFVNLELLEVIYPLFFFLSLSSSKSRAEILLLCCSCLEPEFSSLVPGSAIWYGRSVPSFKLCVVPSQWRK